jgi:hypothetical protein
VKIPKSWNKIPLENFVHYLEYIDEEPKSIEERFELLYKRTCAILGCTFNEARDLSVEDQQKLVRLMAKPMPTRLMLSFKHKGKRYRPIIKVKELSGAKYVAIKNAAKRGTKENLHQVLYLACEQRKFGFRKKFPFIGFYDYKPTEEEIEQGIKDFKTLPMEVANPISIFFLNLSEKLKDLLNDYSMETLRKMTEDMAELQADLEKDMDGSQ